MPGKRWAAGLSAMAPHLVRRSRVSGYRGARGCPDWVSKRSIPDILLESTFTAQRKIMNQHTSSSSDPYPKDARKVTEDQREEQDQLEHQGDDPDAPGLQQSQDDIADESSR
jgi:hypothetical protein